MKKLLLSILFTATLSAFSIFNPIDAYAACPDAHIINPTTPLTIDFKGDIVIESDNCFVGGKEFLVTAVPKGQERDAGRYSYEKRTATEEKHITSRVNFDYLFTILPPWWLQGPEGTWIIRVCTTTSVNTCAIDANVLVTKIELTVKKAENTTLPTDPAAPIIEIGKQSACTYQIGKNPIIHVSNLSPSHNYVWWIGLSSKKDFPKPTSSETDFSFSSQDIKSPQPVTFCVDVKGKSRTGSNCITLNFTAGPPTDTTCKATNTNPSQRANNAPPCGTDIKTAECETAIGKIDVKSPQDFVKQIFSYVLVIAGIGTVILFIYSGYILMTSGGDKQKVQGARETITSAIAGLLFIIFSIALLEFIGVDILKFPGFNR